MDNSSVYGQVKCGASNGLSVVIPHGKSLSNSELILLA